MACAVRALLPEVFLKSTFNRTQWQELVDLQCFAASRLLDTAYCYGWLRVKAVHSSVPITAFALHGNYCVLWRHPDDVDGPILLLAYGNAASSSTAPQTIITLEPRKFRTELYQQAHCVHLDIPDQDSNSYLELQCNTGSETHTWNAALIRHSSSKSPGSSQKPRKCSFADIAVFHEGSPDEHRTTPELQVGPIVLAPVSMCLLRVGYGFKTQSFHLLVCRQCFRRVQLGPAHVFGMPAWSSGSASTK